MPSSRRVVLAGAGSARLPEWATAGAIHADWLVRRGVFGVLAERFQVQREGGYTMEDLFAFGVFHLSTPEHGSIKEFGERSRDVRAQLGALVGRKRLPAPASMSRGLRAVSEGGIEELAGLLLIDVPDCETLLRHPAVQTRDSQGGRWHVFDFDETVTTLRQRALPEGPKLPEPRRRATSMAAPGYSGRKRGDLQFSRAMLQHAGSGLWLDCTISPGNGDRRRATARAIQAVHAACERADARPEQAIIRRDGAGGNVPFFSACREGGVQFITRLARYGLLEDPSIAALLDEGIWCRVASESGPERQALDLGEVLLEAAPSTRREDGSPYDPAPVRVVVSRYLDPNDAGAGRHLGGWRYELYATTLAPDAWPAPDIVAMYYGRCGQENRFAQEDRERSLDRIFSYHLPGQTLVTLIGLMLWNLELCRGLELQGPLPDVPPQSPRRVEVADPPERSLRAALRLMRESSEACSAVPEKPTPTPFAELDAIQRETTALVREAGFEPPDGWKLEDEGPVCPSGHVLTASGVDHRTNGTSLRYLAHMAACAACIGRCSPSTSQRFQKKLRAPLPPIDSQPLEARIRAAQTARQSRSQRARSSWAPDKSPTTARRPPASSPRPVYWDSLMPSTSGILAVMVAVLVPSVLRHSCRRASRAAHVDVVVTQSRPTPRLPTCYAADAAERQHRRATWKQRRKWNALDPQTDVHLVLQASNDLTAWLRRPPQTLAQRSAEPA